jgi:hypothetical protein
MPTPGNGVANNMTYDEVSNRPERIYIPVYTGTKPGFLALVDLAYTYDMTGNITEIEDGVLEETREYQYDFLDPRLRGDLTFAGV